MELLLLLPLSLIIYSDFRTRNVLLWHLLLFGVLQTGVCLYRYGAFTTGWNALINTAILLIVGMIAGLYFLIRFRGKRQSLMGMGDIVFMLLLTPCFTYRSFLYFLISSFSLTLVVWVIWRRYHPGTSEHIPLLSGVGICYGLLLIYRFVTLL